MPRLLLVDDDPSLAAIVRILARRAGHELAWAADARSATAELARQRPDLVLLDINLPGQSGPEWLRGLGADRPPVALFVQSALADDIARGREAGAEAHFAKELVTDAAAWTRRLDELLSAAGRPATSPVS
ncbi:MAG: response regulator [Gemmataceae bacterium]|nr:response regulator [Gemmataceae bacterium]